MNGHDAYGASRNLIENAFSYLTWFEDVCSQIGFKGISQIWKDVPAWYFWQKQVAGAFLLRLHADEPLGESQYLSFSVHYYPSTGENAHQKLSPREKHLLADPANFDSATNTPKFEAYEKFMSEFLVAELGCVIAPDNSLQILFFSSNCDTSHPVHQFLDLMVTVLNFQSKSHHQEAYALPTDFTTTLFLSYSEKPFRYFLETFGLETERMEVIPPNPQLNSWKHAADLDATCSVAGACNCNH